MTCLHCEEPILPGENSRPVNGGRDHMHRECGIRATAGSVGHQTRTCACFGGIGNGDNETKTVRENAKLAAVLFDELNRSQ